MKDLTVNLMEQGPAGQQLTAHGGRFEFVGDMVVNTEPVRIDVRQTATFTHFELRYLGAKVVAGQLESPVRARRGETIEFPAWYIKFSFG